MAALSLVFAVLSFVFVERPIRRMRGIVRRPSLGLAGGVTLIATTLAVATLATPVLASLHFGQPAPPPNVGPGHRLTLKQLASDLRAGVNTRAVPSNLDPRLTAAAQDEPVIAKNGCLLVESGVKSAGCVYGDKTSHTSVVLFGDSHAAAWFPAVNTISKRQHWRLVVLTKSGCPAAAVNVIRHGRVFTNCPIWRNMAEDEIAALHPALVIAAYFSVHAWRAAAAGSPYRLWQHLGERNGGDVQLPTSFGQERRLHHGRADAARAGSRLRIRTPLERTAMRRRPQSCHSLSERHSGRTQARRA